MLGPPARPVLPRQRPENEASVAGRPLYTRYACFSKYFLPLTKRRADRCRSEERCCLIVSLGKHMTGQGTMMVGQPRSGPSAPCHLTKMRPEAVWSHSLCEGRRATVGAVRRLHATVAKGRQLCSDQLTSLIVGVVRPGARGTLMLGEPVRNRQRPSTVDDKLAKRTCHLDVKGKCGCTWEMGDGARKTRRHAQCHHA